MDYTKHFLMDCHSVEKYAKSVLHYFREDEKLLCKEIGDGNINYVFKIWAPDTGKSLIIKQADKVLRSSGRELDTWHSRNEAELLRLYGKLAPDYVPEIYAYDKGMCALSMEDISAYRNSRTAIMAGEVFPTFAADITRFMTMVLLPTTDLVMPSEEKKHMVKKHTNPDLCAISERLVFSEPYGTPGHKNRVTPGNEAYIEKSLYRNHPLRVQAGLLRNNFMNNAQTLLHGDLHTGSIFANGDGIKVIDPEFAFYGPMGYDVGNVLGNLFFSWAYQIYIGKANGNTVNWIRETVMEIYDGFRREFLRLYKKLDVFDLYRESGFAEAYLGKVMSDAVGYAGTEMIRRTVGSSKVPELDAMTDQWRRVKLEQLLIGAASEFILSRGKICCGRDMIDAYTRHIPADI